MQERTRNSFSPFLPREQSHIRRVNVAGNWRRLLVIVPFPPSRSRIRECTTRFQRSRTSFPLIKETRPSQFSLRREVSHARLSLFLAMMRSVIKTRYWRQLDHDAEVYAPYDVSRGFSGEEPTLREDSRKKMILRVDELRFETEYSCIQHVSYLRNPSCEEGWAKE